ncbi:adenosylmethionine--8-amino-7-oxononanoate transaminase [bacterium]|nr:adenosylmethionine--8-amino-7-oxononanoate transaminase [bacterium]
MNPKKNRLVALDRAHVWHPFTPMRMWTDDQIEIIERGEGVFLIDIDGRRLIDGVSSLWCNVHGHRHPTIDRHVRDQLDRIAHSTLLGLAGEPSIELAARLVEILPAGLTRIFYSDSGATAAEVALKMAYGYQVHRGHPERSRFVTFSGAYHGDTIGSVSVGAIDAFHELYRPLLFATDTIPYPFCRACPWGRRPETCETACFDDVEREIERVTETCAGVIIEPIVQGASGIRPAPAGFLARLRAVCDRLGLLLIADEVATGFGRTGTMFACEKENVSPDLMALAKGISGGYLPLAATAATDAIYEAFAGSRDEFRTFFHGHTYTGNALACAAGIGSLAVFDEERVLRGLPAKIDRLARGLARFSDLPHVADVRQAGFMIGIELAEDVAADRPYNPALRMGHRVIRRARELGVIIRPLGDVIVLNPPLAISATEIDALLDATFTAIAQVTEATPDSSD